MALSLEDYRKFGEDMDRWLRLGCYPIAIKMLEKGEAVPSDYKRPVRDLGCHASICQAMAMSRRDGSKMALTKEDMWCFYPVIALGFAEVPQYFLDGKSCLASRTPQATKIWSQSFPRFPAGQYTTVLTAPLKSADFIPDVVLTYCNSSQLSLLLLASTYRTGKDVNCRVGSDAACAFYIVPTMQTGECQVAVPCGGDRRRAIAQDDEIVFAVPEAKLEEVYTGLKLQAETGRGLPRGFGMEMEYPMSMSYLETARQLGMTLE